MVMAQERKAEMLSLSASSRSINSAHGHRFFHQGHTQPLGVDGRIEKFELGIGADHQQRRVSLQDMVSAWHIGNLVGC